MIYIWDNGGEYSEHSIVFIEAEPSPHLETLLTALPKWKILAVAEHVEWRDPKAVSTLAQWWRDDGWLISEFGPQWEALTGATLAAAQALGLVQDTNPKGETK